MARSPDSNSRATYFYLLYAMGDIGRKMKAVFVCTKTDWDHDVIDVFLIVKEKKYYIKGFNDVEWEEAEQFAKDFAQSLEVEYVGDRTDT